MMEVGIICGEAAPALERFAAEEARRYLEVLFGLKPELAMPAKTRGQCPWGAAILIGTPQTNGAVRAALGEEAWPRLSDQGFVIRRASYAGSPALVVGGGSPEATMWAVYDLMERCYGVRYLHWEDVYPEAPGEFALPELDLVVEPAVRVRGWSGWNDFSQEYWGLNDHRAYIDQLAKLKVNAYSLSFWPFHPTIDLRFRGLKRETGALNWGMRFPIEGEVIGRACFGESAEFTNPDLAGCATFAELHGACKALITGIIEHAHRRGLEVHATFSITDFPKEFKEHFRRWTAVPPEACSAAADATYAHIGTESYGTDPTNVSYQNVDDPVLWELAKAVIRAYVDTYPEVDLWTVTTTEFTAPVTGIREKWEHLDRRYGIGGVGSLEQIIAAASAIQFLGKGRVEREVKAALEFLYLLDRVFVEGEVLRTTRRPAARFTAGCIGFTHRVFINVAAKILAQIFPGTPTVVAPPGTYTMAETFPELESWIPPRGENIALRVGYRNEDDLTLMLPQVHARGAKRIMDAVRRHGPITEGRTYSRLVRCQEITGGYIARLFWHPDLSVADFLTDHLGRICGTAAVPAALRAFELLEEATDYSDAPKAMAGFPVPSLMSGYFKAGSPARPEYRELQRRYREVLELMSAARAKAREKGKEFLAYYINLLEFSILFLESCQQTLEAGLAYRQASEAIAARNPAGVEAAHSRCVAALEEAADGMRRALEVRAELALDQSEREILIAGNNFGYQYLQAMHRIVTLESMFWGLSIPEAPD